MEGNKLYIYTLNGCKVCTDRQSKHNQLSSILTNNGVETIGIKYGLIDGVRYEPYEDHDQLCRKIDDPTKYVAPVYILSINDILIKLEDPGSYRSMSQYGNYVTDMIDRALTTDL